MKEVSNQPNNKDIVIINGEVYINGVKLPTCPNKGYSSTIINSHIYLNGYEWKNNKWRRTLKALWYEFF